MPFDPEQYRHHVDHFDMTDEQKIELIVTVARMMESFVDRAFGIDSVQQAVDARLMKDGKAGGLVIDSTATTIPPHQLADAVRPSAGSRRKRKP